ncbi:hypothetical protein CIB84_011859 [Bambusicola thoracicus]|uniref:Uncharacterized protein n=1 Tax=Bambusicola thoracicus TaxID=9083 RepID=A0A2P4SJU9_BAMTH|nr:hypothetical protein CIB84_011859 [Bambusicola thoracicus]
MAQSSVMQILEFKDTFLTEMHVKSKF